MKEEYVGDVNDYRKYALLRHLAECGGVRIGVCWMLTPPDAGNLRQYLRQPAKWRNYDPELFDLLSALTDKHEPTRLDALIKAGVVHRARYFDAMLMKATGRGNYFAAALEKLAGSDLIFFDPDNGIAPTTSTTRRSKFIYLDEIAAAYRRNHSVLLYQHFPRRPRDEFIQNLGADLSKLTDGGQLWCFRTPFAAFLLLIHPQHHVQLVSAAKRTPENWRRGFITSYSLVDSVLQTSMPRDSR